jgi:hypothetical protein
MHSPKAAASCPTRARAGVLRRELDQQRLGAAETKQRELEAAVRAVHEQERARQVCVLFELQQCF